MGSARGTISNDALPRGLRIIVRASTRSAQLWWIPRYRCFIGAWSTALGVASVIWPRARDSVVQPEIGYARGFPRALCARIAAATIR